VHFRHTRSPTTVHGSARMIRAPSQLSRFWSSTTSLAEWSPRRGSTMARSSCGNRRATSDLETGGSVRHPTRDTRSLANRETPCRPPSGTRSATK
jgi:hypothetical protein